MQITRTVRPDKEIADVKLWHCRGCKVVHMSVKGMVLNFTREEFSAFSASVVDINYSGWTEADRSLLDLTEHDADIYITAAVQ